MKLSGTVEPLAIPLVTLKFQLCITFDIHCDSYRYLNTQNQMCKLCTFSQIWSQLLAK